MDNLRWVEENGKHLGFEDGALAYRVYQDEDGWVYEDVQELETYSGCETAEEAKMMAEADYVYKEGLLPESELDELLDVLTDDEYTAEDAEADYWDAVAHERMERAKGFID